MSYLFADPVVLLLSSQFACLVDYMTGKFLKHLAKNLNVLAIYFLKHFIDALSQYVRLYLLMLVKFNYQAHVAEHLLLLSEFYLWFVEHVEHWLVVVSVCGSFITGSSLWLQQGFFHAGSADTAVFLLHLEHLVELLLASGQQQLAEIHLYILLVVKLLE